MNVSFLDLREKEVINVYSGSRLGRIVDIVFDVSSGEVLGIVVPGDKKLFKKSEDVFVPLDKIKRIGSDVILVGIQTEGVFSRQKSEPVKKRGNIDTYYENGYITPSQNRAANLNVQMANASYPENVFQTENQFKPRISPKNENYNKTTAKYQTNSQSQSNTSYVRLRPLESKKYK